MFTIKDREVVTRRFGVLICFESGFPELAGEYVRSGADFLVNATNDYWSGSPIAMYQHAVFSVFRRSSEVPIYRIEKSPRAARRQG